MLKHKYNFNADANFIGHNLPKISLAKKQKTLKKSVSFSGIGLHSGNKIKMILKPAPPDTGFVFRKKNKKGELIEIKASHKNVKSTNMCTLLSNSSGDYVSTVEHILSALYGYEIDNIFIDIDSTEIPVYDGSSKFFINQFEGVGFEEQEVFKKYIKILKTVEVKQDNKLVRVSPFDQTLITSDINFKNRVIGKQSISMLLTPEIYKTQISSARTFGFLDQVDALRKQGLALGGSLENAVVLDKNSVLNPDGLRFSDEFVRHKVLDFIGDISLAGYRLLGSFYTSSSGHELNVKLIDKIFESSSNWKLVCSN